MGIVGKGLVLYTTLFPLQPVFQCTGFCRPVKATLLGGAVAVGAVAAAVRSSYLPAGLLALISVALVATQGGVIVDPNPDEMAAGA